METHYKSVSWNKIIIKEDIPIEEIKSLLNNLEGVNFLFDICNNIEVEFETIYETEVLLEPTQESTIELYETKGDKTPVWSNQKKK